MIGIIPNPEASSHWTDFKAFLAPAAKRGQLDTLIGPHELLWAVFDGQRPIAAATARLTEDNVAEVILVGGSDHRAWIAELDDLIGRAARDAGATCLRAYGRKGWIKTLKAQGWAVMGEADGLVMYERTLGEV
jgi:hypothetical protein